MVYISKDEGLQEAFDVFNVFFYFKTTASSHSAVGLDDMKQIKEMTSHLISDTVFIIKLLAKYASDIQCNQKKKKNIHILH